MLSSVIVTTYNWPPALEKVLEALSHQDDRDFEVIIADDGSTEETKQLVERFAASSSFPLLHIWQEDKGFRAARCRNAAVTASKGELLIFLDGDCVPHRSFISTHKKLATKGYFTAGNRILLTEAYSKEYLDSTLALYDFGIKQWWQLYRQKGCNRFHPSVSLPLGPLRRIGGASWKKARTCNLAVWRSDFVGVNGFDERFEGWGFEDSDLAVRLLKSGVKRLNGKFSSSVAHIWHTEVDRRAEPENWDRFNSVLNGDATQAGKGLDAHMETEHAKLTVLLIVKNEAECIESCLASVSWADQIVVLDSGSEDNTVELCKQYTHEVHSTDWPGFGAQRNRAITHATGDWVLFLDADEQVSEPLKQAIQGVLRAPAEGVMGYEIVRHAYFLGKQLRAGDWGQDQVLRLFKNGKGHYTESAVHERCVVDGNVGFLSAPLQHDTVRSLNAALHKMNVYSSLGAGCSVKRTFSAFVNAWFHGFWTFFRGFILRAGFIDGVEGYLVARLCAEGSFYKYAKRMYQKDMPPELK